MKRRRLAVIGPWLIGICISITIFSPALGKGLPALGKGLPELGKDLASRIEYAQTLIRGGHFKEAEITLHELYYASKDTVSGSMTRLTVLNLLAVVQHKEGNNDEAAKSMTEALSLLSAEQPSDAKAKILSNFSSIYGELGQLHEAIACCQEALSILSSSPGTFTEQSIVLNNYGRLLLESNDFDKAYSIFEKSLFLREKLYGHDSTKLISPLVNMAATEMARKKFSSCELLSKRIMAIAELEEGKDSALLFPALLNLVRINVQNEDYRSGQFWLDRAAQVAKIHFGPDSDETIVVCVTSAQVLASQGCHAQAESTLRSALSHAESLFGRADRRTESLRDALFQIHSRRKEAESSEPSTPSATCRIIK